MRYAVSGYNPETLQPVSVEIGWDHETGYYFGVDDLAGNEIIGKAGILDIAEVINETRAYVTWDLRLTLAAVRLPVDDYLDRNPEADPTAAILRPVSSRG